MRMRRALHHAAAVPVAPPAADLDHRCSTCGDFAEQDHVLRHPALRPAGAAAQAALEPVAPRSH